VTRNRRYHGLTVEKLAVDCLDVRELQRAGIFKDHWVALPMVSLRWPGVEKMRAARYLIQLKFRNQVVLQQIPVSWTRCYYGGTRPWLHCTFLRAAGGAIVQGNGRLLLSPLHRKSALRKSAPEQEGAGLFAGLPTAAKPRRVASDARSGAGTTVPHEAKDL
jgi:hypothetical protein